MTDTPMFTKESGKDLIPVMEYQLECKIQELFRVSAEKEDYSKGFDLVRDKMNRQEAIMDDMKELARKLNTLKGRMIKFPCADSYSLYVITKVNKRTVRIKWVDFCDGWVDSRCGHEAVLDIEYATKEVQGEDFMEELFSKKKTSPTIVCPVGGSDAEVIKKFES
jgi:hypothetical protein